jgi:hypothetical protein
VFLFFFFFSFLFLRTCLFSLACPSFLQPSTYSDSPCSILCIPCFSANSVLSISQSRFFLFFFSFTPLSQSPDQGLKEAPCKKVAALSTRAKKRLPEGCRRGAGSRAKRV